MSKGASPSHFFSENAGNYFDPAFTEEISSKMLVPDRISVVGENSAQLAGRYQFSNDQQKFTMNVPERILVAGGDKHIGGRESLPELRLESSLPLHSQAAIQLSTPPNVITLNEHHYPTIIEDTTENISKSRYKIVNEEDNEAVQDQQSFQSAASTDLSPHSPEEELALLRRQVKHLSRRVFAIEQDNQQRQQREVVLYSLGVIYFLLKGLAWLHKNW